MESRSKHTLRDELEKRLRLLLRMMNRDQPIQHLPLSKEKISTTDLTETTHAKRLLVPPSHLGRSLKSQRKPRAEKKPEGWGPQVT